MPDIPGASIYCIAASRFWQFRICIAGRLVRKSTKETDKQAALKKAKILYREAKLTSLLNSDLHPETFNAAAKSFLRLQQSLVDQDRVSKRTFHEDKLKLDKDILPYFRAFDVGSINKQCIEGYLATLSDRKLSRSTLAKHLQVIRKVLGHSADNGTITNIPRFPKIKGRSRAVGSFDLKSFQLLWTTAFIRGVTRHYSSYRIKERSVRRLHYTPDLAAFILFNVNSFARLKDYILLKHERVEVRRNEPPDGATYLEIYPPDEPKVSENSSVTLERAVDVYESLRTSHRKLGFGRNDDYVFYPQHRNRRYVYDLMRRLFADLLEFTDLRKDNRGRFRTLYSLRHTALNFRALYGLNPDSRLLADNALTSVNMLERFYMRAMENKRRVKEIQANKSCFEKSVKLYLHHPDWSKYSEQNGVGVSDSDTKFLIFTSKKNEPQRKDPFTQKR